MRDMLHCPPQLLSPCNMELHMDSYFVDLLDIMAYIALGNSVIIMHLRYVMMVQD